MWNFVRRAVRRNYGQDKEYYRIIDELFGFVPHNIELYKLALIHKSASLVLADGRQINNERLEFLGDAVIEAVTSDYLYILPLPESRQPDGRGDGFQKSVNRMVSEDASYHCFRNGARPELFVESSDIRRYGRDRRYPCGTWAGRVEEGGRTMCGPLRVVCYE